MCGRGGAGCFGGRGGVRLSGADHAPVPDIKMSASIRTGAAELITQWGTWLWTERGGLRGLPETLGSAGEPLLGSSHSQSY